MATHYLKHKLIRDHSFGNFNGELVSQLLRDNKDICSALFFLIHPERLSNDHPAMVELQRAEIAFMKTFMKVDNKQTGLFLAIEGREPERIFNMIERCKVDKVEQIKDKALMLWWN